MTPRPRLLVLASSFALAASLALAQESAGPQSPNKLAPNIDQLIATALKLNPDVILAEAKLRQAQAELHQTRLKISRDVVTAWNESKEHAGALQAAQEHWEELKKAHAAGSVSKSDLDEARGQMREAQLAIAQSEAELRYLTGSGSQVESDPFDKPAATETKRQMVSRPTGLADFHVDALDRQVSGPFKNTNLIDLLKRMSDEANVAIIVDNKSFVDDPIPVSIPLRDKVTLNAALGALADQYDVCFLFRDYGILAANNKRARSINATAIPKDLPLNPAKDAQPYPETK